MIVLVYPRLAREDEEMQELGACSVFERITIDHRVILGVEIEGPRNRQARRLPAVRRSFTGNAREHLRQRLPHQ